MFWVNEMSSFDRDRKQWRTVRFDQMAENITDRVENPSEAGVERYVGLEHLDPESLKIRRWGSPRDVEATKLRFRSGDIIFGKRRFYQRKLAVADFDGICSAHALVLRARTDTVLPEFLPFFMQSEGFFQSAMSISVGSLSPTINWSALARQEFALPPKEEQRWIAQVLWAAEDALENQDTVLTRMEQVERVLVRHIFTYGLHARKTKTSAIGALPENWDAVKMKDLARSINNGYVGKSAEHYIDAGGIPYLMSNNVRENKIDLTKLVHISQEFHRANPRSQLETGDLLTVQSGHIGTTCVVPAFLNNANCHALIISKLYANKINPDFLSYYLNCSLGRTRLSSLYIGTTVPHINTSDFREFYVPVPPLLEQSEIATVMLAFQKQIRDYEKHNSRSKQLKKSLLATSINHSSN